jgi:cobalt transporter subunit CbtA
MRCDQLWELIYDAIGFRGRTRYKKFGSKESAMLRKILATALIAGFLAGIAISVVQEFTTTPIILHAEEFEGGEKGGAHKHSQARAFPRIILAHGEAPKAVEEEVWGPSRGLERTAYTTLANVLTGVGFALILVACFALAGRPVNGQSGVLWGLAGFAIFTLAPALGLPPEVPGSMAAELVPRQSWWFLCVAATAAGLWLLVFRAGVAWKVAAITILALPHLIGAPHPAQIGGAVPPELAGHFAAASIVTACIFWSVLGWVSGRVWQHLEAS